MAKEINWNTVLVILVIGVVGILLLSNSGITGMQIFRSKGVKANSCDADGTCEMINAQVGSLHISSNLDRNSIYSGDPRSGDVPLTIGSTTTRLTSGSLYLSTLMTKREKGIAFVCANKEDGKIFSSNVPCDKAKML